MNVDSDYSYNVVNSIDEFHELLLWNEKCKNFQERDNEMIFRAARFAEEIHKSEMRSASALPLPYITHPIAIVQEYIKNTDSPNPRSITVLLLHDVVESSPESWWELLATFPIDIVYRVLKLSKPKKETCKEMSEYFSEFDTYYAREIRDLLESDP